METNHLALRCHLFKQIPPCSMITALLLVIDLKMAQITLMITTEFQALCILIRLSQTGISYIGLDTLAFKLLGIVGLMLIGMNSKE